MCRGSQPQCAYTQFVPVPELAVRHGIAIMLAFVIAAQRELGANLAGERTCSRSEIGVDVCLGHKFNDQIMLCGVRYVAVEIRRIGSITIAFTLRRHDVRVLCQTRNRKLLDRHRLLLESATPLSCSKSRRLFAASLFCKLRHTV